MSRLHLAAQLAAVALGGVVLWHFVLRPEGLRRRQRALERELKELERRDQEERAAARELAVMQTWPYFRGNAAA